MCVRARLDGRVCTPLFGRPTELYRSRRRVVRYSWCIRVYVDVREHLCVRLRACVYACMCACAAAPKFKPVTVTEPRPECGVFRTSSDWTGGSNENTTFDVPVTAHTVTWVRWGTCVPVSVSVRVLVLVCAHV